MAKRRLGVPLECPPPMYKKGEERWPAQGGRAMGGVLLGLPVQVGFAPLSYSHQEKGEGGEGEKERGAAPQPLSNSDWAWGARPLFFFFSLLFSTKAHYGPNSSPGVPVTLPVFR